MLRHSIAINNYWRFAKLEIEEAPWYLFLLEWILYQVAWFINQLTFLDWLPEITIEAGQDGYEEGFKVGIRFAIWNKLANEWINALHGRKTWKCVSLELPYKELEKLFEIDGYDWIVEEVKDPGRIWEQEIEEELIGHSEGFILRCPITKVEITGSSCAINRARLKEKARRFQKIGRKE